MSIRSNSFVRDSYAVRGLRLSVILCVMASLKLTIGRAQDPSPTIIVPPKSQPIFSGALMVFNVTAGGGDPLYYQWQKQGASLPGETATNLVINNVQSADAGNYSVVVSNNSGSVTSAPAALTVTSSPFHFPRSGAPITLGGPPMPSGLTDVVA